MRLKPHITKAASTATLPQIVKDFDQKVADQHKRQALVDVISSAALPAEGSSRLPRRARGQVAMRGRRRRFEGPYECADRQAGGRCVVDAAPDPGAPVFMSVGQPSQDNQTSAKREQP